MRKFELLLSVLGLVGMACARPEITRSTRQPTGALTVKIVDGVTGSGVGGATLWLRLSEAPQATRRRFYSNDSSGIVLIADLPIGQYAVRAQSLGFVFRDTIINVDKPILQPLIMRLERDTLTLR